MLLADLRGFSRLTDELPEEQIVKLLNAFFDLVVPGVVAGGGDILKYIGAAVIAIFPVAGDDPAPACELALAAARTALAALQSAPPEIQQRHQRNCFRMGSLPPTLTFALKAVFKPGRG